MDEFTKGIVKGLSIMFLSAVALIIALSVQSDARACHDPTRPVPVALEPSEQNCSVLTPLDAIAEVVVEMEQETEPVTEEETCEEVPIIAEEPEKIYYDIPLSHAFQDYVRETAESFDLDPDLLYAIMEEESLFRANAVSKSNDFGLCQINAINNDWLYEHYGLTDMLNPYQNVIAGCAILKWTQQFTDGSLEQLLLCYGCGVGRGLDLWEQGVRVLPFGEKMMAILNEFKEGKRNESD